MQIKHISKKKSLGQNFLIDANIANKIASLALPLNDNSPVIEIGAGLGFLTRHILSLKGIKELYLVEKDDRFIEPLKLLANQNKHLDIKVINANGTDTDIVNLSFKRPFKERFTLLGNLPYNVASHFIMQWLKYPKLYKRFVIMVQKEVADRLIGKEKNGFLSTMARSICNITKAFDVSPNCFRPRPKVMSSVIVMDVKSKQNVSFEQMYPVSQELFKHKRKIIKSALKILNVQPEDLNINPNLRAEQLKLKDIIAIAKYINK